MADEDQHVPAAAEGEISLDEAVKRLNPPADESAQAAQTPHQEPAQDEPKGSEGEEAPAREAAEPGDEPENDDRAEDEGPELTGNFSVRLRDGTKVAAKDLRKAYAEHRDLERKAEELARKEQELTARASQPAQLDPRTKSILDNAVKQLEAQIPPEPDPSLRQTDPLEYTLQIQDRQRAYGNWLAARQAQHAEQQRSEAEAATERQQYIAREQAALAKVMPELADPQKGEEFWKKALPVGRRYGFDDQALNSSVDHRFMLIMRDLVAYDELKAEVEKAKKQTASPQPAAQRNPPVLAPGKRTNAAPSRNDQATVQRFNRTHSLDDALAVLQSSRNR